MYRREFILLVCQWNRSFLWEYEFGDSIIQVQLIANHLFDLLYVPRNKFGTTKRNATVVYHCLWLVFLKIFWLNEIYVYFYHFLKLNGKLKTKNQQHKTNRKWYWSSVLRRKLKFIRFYANWTKNMQCTMWIYDSIFNIFFIFHVRFNFICASIPYNNNDGYLARTNTGIDLTTL